MTEFMKKNIIIIFLFSFVLCLFSCQSQPPAGDGPIIASPSYTTPEITTNPDIPDEPTKDQEFNFSLNQDGKSYCVYGIGSVKAKNIAVPENYKGLPVTKINAEAFKGCDYIEKIILPDSIIEMGMNAFNNCTALKELVLPKNLKSIGNLSFLDCQSLKKINIPSSLSSIGIGVFINCSALEEITVDEGNENYYVKQNCLIDRRSKTLVRYLPGALIPTDGSVTTFGDSSFSGLYNLTNIQIPESITEIKDFAFLNCKNLKHIYFNKNLKMIGNQAFGFCLSLETVILPKNLEEIGVVAFDGCIALKTLTLSESLNKIGSNAFRNCDALEEIIYPNDKNSFNQIKLGAEWNPGGVKIKIVCTDESFETERDDYIIIFEWM